MEELTLFTPKATVGSCVGMLAIGGLFAAYGPAIAEFKAQFGVSDAMAGSGLAIESAAAVVGVLVAQPVLRRFGNRLTIGTSLLLIALGCIAIGVAADWPMTVLGAALAGVGMGGYDSLVTQLLVLGHGRRGPALVNVAHGCFGLGTVLAPAVLAVVGSGNYRMVFGGIAAIAAGAILTLSGLASRPTPADVADGERREPSPVQVPKLGIVAVIGGFVLLYVTHFGVEAGIGTWGPSRLLDLGHSGPTASLVIAGYWLAMVAGRFAAAGLVGRFALSTIVTVSCLGMTVSAALAASGSMTVGAYLLAGLFIGPIFPSGLAWLAETGYAGGSAFAYVVAAAMAGAALFPPVLGAILGSYGTFALAPTLAVTSLVALATCGGLIFVMRRTASARVGADAGHCELSQ